MNHIIYQVKLKGDSLNRNGLGTWIELYYNGKQQVYEQYTLSRLSFYHANRTAFWIGYMLPQLIHYYKMADGKKQVIQNVPANQTITIDT